VQQHHDLLQRRVARPLADAVTAHSTWRAPASTPANEFATARPRSSWQCTLNTDAAQRRHQLVQPPQVVPELLGHRVADRVGMLMTVAPSSMAIAHTSAVNSRSARVASIGEN